MFIKTIWQGLLILFALIQLRDSCANNTFMDEFNQCFDHHSWHGALLSEFQSTRFTVTSKISQKRCSFYIESIVEELFVKIKVWYILKGLKMIIQKFLCNPFLLFHFHKNFKRTVRWLFLTCYARQRQFILDSLN